MKSASKFLWIGLIVVVVLIIGAISYNSTPAGTADPAKLVHSDSHQTAVGTTTYKVTLVEFGDLECPACGQAHPYIKKIISDNKDRINFVFRHFPLPQHANALIAAEATEAAAEQGKFWEMHDRLYETQDKWGDSQQPMDVFIEIAKDLGLNIETFTQEVTSNKFADKINADAADGNMLGVDSTPTFYVNGSKVQAFAGSPEFMAKIQAELNK